MNNECMAMLAEQWEHICQNYSSDDLLHAFQFIQDHSLILVEEFYKAFFYKILQPKSASDLV